MRVNSSQENSAGVTEKHIHKLGVYTDLRTGLVEGCGLEIVDREGALSSGPMLRSQQEHVCAPIHIHTHVAVEKSNYEHQIKAIDTNTRSQ